MTDARPDLRIREAIWMHSHAGKKPRPEHVKMDGKTYNITKGMWDPHEKKRIFRGVGDVHETVGSARFLGRQPAMTRNR